MSSENSSTTSILAEIYEDKCDTNRFAIQGFQSRVGQVRYLDEPSYVQPKVTQDNDLNFSLFGGAAKKPKTVKADEKPIYPSLNDIPDKDVKEFLSACHIDYITSNHKSNSIFIVPDKKFMDAIKEDIKKSLGNIKPDTPEAILHIKSAKLIYKACILDVHGDNDNGGFQYRIPQTYPDEFDDSVVYRRTSRYDNHVFYIQLTKKGCKISNESDMSGAITLEFVDRIGRLPNYVSYVMKGNILPLLSEKASAKKKTSGKKKSIKRRFQELMKANEYDKEAGAYKFVGEMIESFGVDKCKPYYGANFLQSALSMITAFGEKAPCDCGCGDIDGAHMSMMKSWKPKVRALLTSQNIAKITDYSAKYVDSMVGFLADNDYAKAKSYTSDRYFKQIKNAYKQVASDIKSDNELNNTIAGDVGYGIYENTGNLELALEMMNSTKQCLANGKNMSSQQLNAAANLLSDFVFHSFNSQSFYPIVNTSSKPTMKMSGGDPDEDDDELELNLEGGKCTCGKCPECLKKKADEEEEEPKTIDDMEKLDELI